MTSTELDRLARIIWDYHRMHQALERADVMLVLGSHDLRVADYAARLWIDGWAPLLVCSGGAAHQDDLLNTGWDKTEAEMFADRAVAFGVPRDNILIENRSQNTGQNIAFAYELLKRHNALPNKLILVQKPYMERRTYATLMKQWPGDPVKMIVTSPPIAFEDYPNAEISKDEMINIMVGDLQRIKEYPARGYQVPQEIPQEVWGAYESLIMAGYDQHLIRN